jgi:hypothetical protein
MQVIHPPQNPIQGHFSEQLVVAIVTTTTTTIIITTTTTTTITIITGFPTL